MCLRKAQSAEYGVIGDAISLDILEKKNGGVLELVQKGACRCGPLDFDLKVFCTII